MGGRVPVEHYSLRSANSYIGSSLHDLNTVDVDPRQPDIQGISAGEDSLDNDHDSNAVDCMHESYRSSLPLHNVGVVEDRSSIDNNVSSRCPYDILTVDDISPIESSRARFLQIIVDYFIRDHVIEVAGYDADYDTQSGQDKMTKRKPREIRCEGDPRFALPLMYVANMYETLAQDANMRLASLNGVREKTIGISLEAAGGLYRSLAKKFPKKGPCIFKRRELATSVETRTRFPELVIQEEKRVRFVVVNGLDIVEKPNNIPPDDAEWFKRLTGRNEVAVCPGDYKFYSPRHKYRRTPSNPPQTPPKHHMQSLPPQPQFHPINQSHHQSIHLSQHTGQYSQHHHQCGPTSHLNESAHVHQSSTISQHMACLQPLTGGHIGGRLHVMPTSPAKFCDECGAQYLRETSKFCSECGSKRLGT